MSSRRPASGPPYDEFGRARPVEAFAKCQRCHRWITYGQAYMPRIPFRGSWRGFDHQFCPPRLVVA
ncbi:MAG: hypothetical protein ACRDS9_27305 [Pseudonocardiaceae bacterium]